MLGIIAFACILLGYYGLPIGIAGAIVGILALRSVAKGTQGGKSMAMTGTILSAVAVVLGLIWGIVAPAVLNDPDDRLDSLASIADKPREQPSREAATKPSREASAKYASQAVNQTWTDPATQDTVKVTEFVVGGPASGHKWEDSILVGINITLHKGMVYDDTDANASDFAIRASKGWISGADTFTFDATDVSAKLAEYGLTGNALNPHARPDEREDLSGWVFYEVPKGASGDWSLRWIRPGFSVIDGGTDVAAGEMNIPLGTS